MASPNSYQQDFTKSVLQNAARTREQAAWELFYAVRELLGLDDAALLMATAEAGLVLVAFDRATLPWHAGQVLRAGESHGGLILFRRTVRATNYGHQARLLTDFWVHEGYAWDWLDRIVYLPKAS